MSDIIEEKIMYYAQCLIGKDTANSKVMRMKPLELKSRTDPFMLCAADIKANLEPSVTRSCGMNSMSGHVLVRKLSSNISSVKS
jgi:hypothetical protein